MCQTLYYLEATRYYLEATSYYLEAMRYYLEATRYYLEATRYYLEATSYYLEATRYYLEATRYYLEAMRYYLEATRYYLEATRYYLEAMRYYLEATRYYLEATSYYLEATRYYLEATRYYLEATSYYLEATSYYLEATRYYLEATSYYLEATSYYLEATRYYLEATSYYLEATSYYLEATKTLGWTFVSVTMSSHLCVLILFVLSVESISVTEGDSVTLNTDFQVEYQDNNTYSCVIYNPIRNQTTHLDINKLCHTCAGVFGLVTDEVKSVSVTEGDSVTLNTDVKVQRDDQILWMFGPQETRIAELYKQNIDMFGSNKIFGDRLQMDSQTGSLTIRNINKTHSGLYKLQIRSDRRNSDKIINVTVYAPLPIPFITGSSQQCFSSRSSESRCSLVCSVLNVSDVTLSWYKGISVLSSISVSDLSISLSLPLEVEYQDKNTYSCVIYNPITNQTSHLDNISRLCHTCKEQNRHSYFILIIISVCLLVFTSAVILICCSREFSRAQQKDQESMSEYTEIIYRLQI
ncbi:unnamed protein product [Leuciscus chuanchicus]